MQKLTSLVVAGLLTVAVSLPTLAASAGTQVATHAQAGDNYKNVVYANPFWLIVGGLSVGYERALTDNVSIVVAGLGLRNSTELEGETYRVSLGSVVVQPHYYFRETLRGPYIAPFVGVGGSSVSGPGVEASGLSYQTGTTVGWSWIFWKRVNFKLGIGGRYASQLAATSSGGVVEETNESRFGLAGDLRLGIAF